MSLWLSASCLGSVESELMVQVIVWREYSAAFSLIQLGMGIVLVQGGETGEVRGLTGDKGVKITFTSKMWVGDGGCGGVHGRQCSLM